MMDHEPTGMTAKRHWMAEGSCDISFDGEVPCVVMVWQGYVPSRDFRDANERVLALVRETGATKLLGDIEGFTLIGADDQRWLNQSWIPRAVATGVRTCALVQPVYYFNKVAVENVVRDLGQVRLTVSHFNQREEARAWLTQVP